MERIPINKVALIIISFICLSFYTPEDDNNIIWNKNYRLKWEDFLGSPVTTSPFSAMSHVTLSPSFEYRSSEDLVDVEIKICFVKNKSWVNPGKKINSLLLHEQGHFNIGELIARKMRKKVMNTKFKKNNIQSKFNAIFNEISKEMISYHNLYDHETNHHINKVKQAQWELKIEKQLKKLESYSESHFTLKVN